MTETVRMLAVRMDLAWAEFDYLGDAFRGLSEEWTDSSVTERQSDGVTYLVKARPGIVDPMLRVRTGTFIHHVRATLDNLAWGLATKVKREPGKVSFPIERSPRAFRATKWVRVLGTAAPCVVAAEALQPYEHPDARCLLVLNDLWNQDKHRAAAVLPVVPTRAVVIRKTHETEPSFTPYWPRRSKTVKKDQVLGKFVMPPDHNEPPKGGLVLQPVLNVRGPLNGRLLPDALFQMYEFVHHEVMPVLVPFLQLRAHRAAPKRP
jgi:hypothetical protein